MGNKDDIPFQQNLDIIQPLLENLSITYESWIKYVNSSGAYIYTPINKQQCNFCRLIRSHPVGYQRCRERGTSGDQNSACARCGGQG
jgi:two-component system LytT family sensor kinase